MFSEPQKNIEQFHIDPGMTVADLGAGAGFYSFILADVVGKTGRVYAVDVQQALLTKLKNDAIANNLENIDVVWGDIEEDHGTTLADQSVDRVVIANTLFQVHHKENLIKEAKRILKPNGKLLLIDWADSFGGLGPSKSSVVAAPQARALFEKEGFIFDRENSAGSHHYGIVFKNQ